MNIANISRFFCLLALVAGAAPGCQQNTDSQAESYQGNSIGGAGTGANMSDPKHPMWALRCRVANPATPIANLDPAWKKSVTNIKYDEATKTVTWEERCTSQWKLMNPGDPEHFGCLSEICEWNHPQVCPFRDPKTETMIWNDEKKACEVETVATAAAPVAAAPVPVAPAPIKPFVDAPAAAVVSPPVATAPISDSPTMTAPTMTAPTMTAPSMTAPEKKSQVSTGEQTSKFRVEVKAGVQGHFRRFRGSLADNAAAKGQVCELSSGTQLFFDDVMFVQHKYAIPGGEELKALPGEQVPSSCRIGKPAASCLEGIPAPAPYDQMMYVLLAADVVSKDGKACNFKKGQRGYIFLGHFDYANDVKEKCRSDYREVISKTGNVFKECK